MIRYHPNCSGDMEQGKTWWPRVSMVNIIIQNRFGRYLLMKWMVLSWWQKKIYLNPMLIFSASQIFKKNNRSYGYATIIKMIILLSTILDKRYQRISKTWKSWLQSRIRYFDWSWENKIEIQQIFIKLCPSFATSTRKRRTNFGQLSSFFFYFVKTFLFS